MTIKELVEASLEQNILSALKKLNIPVTKIEPGDDCVDTSIELGGKYTDLSISVGYFGNYYSISKQLPNGNFLFIDGKGNLQIEILQCKLSNGN